MTHGEIDGLLLKHVFGEDPDKPRAWYGLFLRGGRFLCECWAGLGLVVEEMGKEEPPWHLLLEYDEDEWRAVFQNQDFRKWEDALHPTLAPMAVSLAALRAVGVEIPAEEVPR